MVLVGDVLKYTMHLGSNVQVVQIIRRLRSIEHLCLD